MRYFLLALLLLPTLASAQVNITFDGPNAEREAARYVRYIRYELAMLPKQTLRNVEILEWLGFDQLASKYIYTAIKERQEPNPVALRYGYGRKQREERVDSHANGDAYEQARDNVFREAYRQVGM